MKLKTLPNSKLYHDENGIRYIDVYHSIIDKVINKPTYKLKYNNQEPNEPATVTLRTEPNNYALGKIVKPPTTYDMSDVSYEPILPSIHDMANDYLYQYDKDNDNIKNINQYQYDTVKTSLHEQHWPEAEIDKYMVYYKEDIMAANPYATWKDRKINNSYVTRYTMGDKNEIMDVLKVDNSNKISDSHIEVYITTKDDIMFERPASYKLRLDTAINNATNEISISEYVPEENTYDEIDYMKGNTYSQQQHEALTQLGIDYVNVIENHKKYDTIMQLDAYDYQKLHLPETINEPELDFSGLDTNELSK